LVKTCAFHSFKGGTGKTFLAVNLSALHAYYGGKVCLVDMDFRAPTVITAFGHPEVKYWFNDYLNGFCKPEEALVDVSKQLEVKGTLKVAFANPSMNAVRDMLAKDRKWEAQALKRLLTFKRYLEQEGYDSCLIDTSPGFMYSSINAVVASDLAIVVSTMDDSDVEGTKRLIKDLYEVFEKKTAVVVNKVMPEPASLSKDLTYVQMDMQKLYDEPVIGVIPCLCDVARLKRSQILALKQPNHWVAQSVKKLLTYLIAFNP